MINLLSDTVTKPTPGMLKAMMSAEVGDDVFNEDPTVNELQEKVADMFGMESAIFCPSGTMTNQIALKVHTKALDEVWCDVRSHIYQYEVGGYSFHSGIGIKMTDVEGGILSVSDLKALEHPVHDWLPRPKLVVLENTCNKGGGTCYDLQNMKDIKSYCKQEGLALHLDGARLFNAIVAKGYQPEQVGECFDSISICLSKGLGAPVGSLLIGERDFIAEARRVRKVMGGGMRQVGYLAAAGMYALDHHLDKLEEDHQKAQQLAASLAQMEHVVECKPPETNIVLFEVTPEIGTAAEVSEKLNDRGVGAAPFGAQIIRLVTHLDVSMEDIKTAIQDMQKVLNP